MSLPCGTTTSIGIGSAKVHNPCWLSNGNENDDDADDYDDDDDDRRRKTDPEEGFYSASFPQTALQQEHLTRRTQHYGKERKNGCEYNHDNSDLDEKLSLCEHQ